MTNQSLEYAMLAKTMTYNDLPRLRMFQYKRAALNIRAGLELGISERESVRMAAEDFATPAEKMIEAQLTGFYRQVLAMEEYDRQELNQTMRELDIFPTRAR